MLLTYFVAYKDPDKRRARERVYHLERYHRIMAESIALLGGKCAKCGATENLEIDHIDPAQKSFTISMLWGIAKAQREKELAKCQALCNPCHKDKSLAAFPPRQHGTYTMYKRGKCRCDPCVVAGRAKGNEYSRKSKARKKNRASSSNG